MDKSLLLEKWKQLSLMFVFGVFGGCIYFNLLWRFQGSLFQNEWGMIFDRILNCSIKEFYAQIIKYAIWILALQFMIFVLGFMKIGKILFRIFNRRSRNLIVIGVPFKRGGYFPWQNFVGFSGTHFDLGNIADTGNCHVFFEMAFCRENKKMERNPNKKISFLDLMDLYFAHSLHFNLELCKLWENIFENFLKENYHI